MSNLPAVWRQKIRETFVSSISVFGLEPVEFFGHIFANAWSSRLTILAAALSAFEIGFPLIFDVYPLPPIVYAILMMVITFAANIARLVSQKQTIPQLYQPAPPAPDAAQKGSSNAD